MWCSRLLLSFAWNTLEQSVSTSSEADILLTPSTPEKWKYLVLLCYCTSPPELPGLLMDTEHSGEPACSNRAIPNCPFLPSPGAATTGTGIRSSPSHRLMLLSDLNLNPIQPKPHMSQKAHFHCTALWSNRQWLCKAAGPSGLSPCCSATTSCCPLFPPHTWINGSRFSSWASSIGSLFQQHSPARVLIPWSGSPDETCTDGSTRRKGGREQDQPISQQLGKDHFSAYS